jgi:FkbM family methyltransferase
MNFKLTTVDNYHDNKITKFLTYPRGKCIISDFITQNIIWEPFMHRIFEKYVTNDSVVIEGGCHIGTHTVKLAYLCKHVYAFEPMPKSNEILKTNMALNNITNVTIFEKGLSNNFDTQSYQWISQNNPGASGLRNNNPMGDLPGCRNEIEDQITVDLITIDSLNLDRLDFIKLDIEGYEPLAIEGAMGTIIKYKPVITLEVYKNHDGCVDINYSKNLFKNLLDIGYTVQHVQWADFLFIPAPQKKTN